jgi:ribosomal protein S18 acetylase RimI-like enzyme
MSSVIKRGLIKRHQLDASELGAVQELAQICNEHERLGLKLNWNILRNRTSAQPGDFLYYADGKLVGFLALFSFSSHEGEVSGMVHPAYRRRGIFRKLFEAARQECRSRDLTTLLLIVEPTSPGGLAFAKRLGSSYDHSEYKMVLEEPRLPRIVNQHLQFLPARSEDLPVLAQITAQAFKMPGDTVDWYTEQTLAQANRRFFVGVVDDVVVGKIDIALSEDMSLIFGFAVLPEHQGQGYGRQILARAVQEILSTGQRNIELEVSIDNEHALSLYRSCGFKETGSYGYYRLQVN